MTSPLNGHAVDIARAVPIEEELARRGHHLKRKGKELAGPCPVCGGFDRFVVSQKKRLWFCRGCNKGGDVIELVQYLDRLEFLGAVEVLSGERPQQERDGERAIRYIINRAARSREQQEREAREAAQDTAYALGWWNEGVGVWGTPAQMYLTSRRCDGMFPIDRDAVFRFHPSCVFGRGKRMPCLLSLLRNVQTDEPQAVHRTALTPDGDKIDQEIDRMTLGPKAGAAIKLWPQSCIRDRLVVGEGLETTLAPALHADDCGSRLDPAWSLVDASGIRSLQPIPGVNTLIILVDNDASGTGQKAAQECAERWNKAGRNVIRLTPKIQGTDFNDVIKGNSHAA
jgi:phage/plasmid primase-like uncharacterized protein